MESKRWKSYSSINIQYTIYILQETSNKKLSITILKLTNILSNSVLNLIKIDKLPITNYYTLLDDLEWRPIIFNNKLLISIQYL